MHCQSRPYQMSWSASINGTEKRGNKEINGLKLPNDFARTISKGHPAATHL